MKQKTECPSLLCAELLKDFDEKIFIQSFYDLNKTTVKQIIKRIFNNVDKETKYKVEFIDGAYGTRFHLKISNVSFLISIGGEGKEQKTISEIYNEVIKVIKIINTRRVLIEKIKVVASETLI